MMLCQRLRQHDIFMYATNLKNYGYIKEDINKDITIFDIDKKEIWEKKYLHESYYLCKNNLRNLECQEYCQDVFNFPLFSDAFCDELINLANVGNHWSDGKYSNKSYDVRIDGIENYPTQDVHLNQFNFDKQWEIIIMTYVAELASLLYSNYKTKGTNINFIVKYNPTGQADLEPHHDASTYTINVALNTHNVDYKGGGCRFIRQNYSVIGQSKGTATMHPGRLTHYHEGLPTIHGTRYILVSFIN